jgi:hypothetical protein
MRLVMYTMAPSPSQRRTSYIISISLCAYMCIPLASLGRFLCGPCLVESKRLVLPTTSCFNIRITREPREFEPIESFDIPHSIVPTD